MIKLRIVDSGFQVGEHNHKDPYKREVGRSESLTDVKTEAEVGVIEEGAISQEMQATLEDGKGKEWSQGFHRLVWRSALLGGFSAPQQAFGVGVTGANNSSRQHFGGCCSARDSEECFISRALKVEQSNLVLMLCQKSSDNELLELGEKELCAVPQAFSGGQQSVS